MDEERIEKQLAFCKEIDKEKEIFRQTYLADGSERKMMPSMPGIWR